MGRGGAEAEGKEGGRTVVGAGAGVGAGVGAEVGMELGVRPGMVLEWVVWGAAAGLAVDVE